MRDTCNDFASNPELYGLRIRFGIYLQWISSFLTNVLLPDGVSDSLDTNSSCLFAVFIAKGFHPVEALMMLQSCFGYLLFVLSVGGLQSMLVHNASAETLLSKLQHISDLTDTMPSET